MTNSLDQALLQQLAIPAPDLATVASRFRHKHLAKGDVWLKQGDPVQVLAYQQSGLLRVAAWVETPNYQKDVTQWISQPGYFLTDVAGLYRQQPSRWTISALSPIDLMVITETDLLWLTDNLPNWPKIERAFIAKCFEMVENRLFTHLYQSAEERYLQLMAYAPHLFNEVPLQYLASMLGMTQETLSRLRSKRA